MVRRISVTRRGLAELSLIALRVGMSAYSASCSGVTSTVYPTGLLYSIQSRSVAAATARKYAAASAGSAR